MINSQRSEEKGKSAFVWIIGSFGEKVPEAPYILEKIIDDETEGIATSLELQTYLVVACTRLFFKRAPEMHPILSKFYKQVMYNS